MLVCTIVRGGGGGRREGGRGSFGGRITGRMQLSDIDGKRRRGAREGGREGTDGLQDSLTDGLKERKFWATKDEIFGGVVAAAVTAACASMVPLLFSYH